MVFLHLQSTNALASLVCRLSLEEDNIRFPSHALCLISFFVAITRRQRKTDTKSTTVYYSFPNIINFHDSKYARELAVAAWAELGARRAKLRSDKTSVEANQIALAGVREEEKVGSFYFFKNS